MTAYAHSWVFTKRLKSQSLKISLVRPRRLPPSPTSLPASINLMRLLDSTYFLFDEHDVQVTTHTHGQTTTLSLPYSYFWHVHRATHIRRAHNPGIENENAVQLVSPNVSFVPNGAYDFINMHCVPGVFWVIGRKPRRYTWKCLIHVCVAMAFAASYASLPSSSKWLACHICRNSCRVPNKPFIHEFKMLNRPNARITSQ